MRTGEYSSYAIGETFKEGLSSIKFSDLAWCEEIKDFIFLGAAPVYDLSNKLLGTVIAEVSYSQIDPIVSQRDGLGETGEIYILGSDSFMRSKSRFFSQNTILKLEINTEAKRDAVAGNSDVKVIRDYRNIPVLSAYTPLENLKDVSWALFGGNRHKRGLLPGTCPENQSDYHRPGYWLHYCRVSLFYPSEKALV